VTSELGFGFDVYELPAILLLRAFLSRISVYHGRLSRCVEAEHDVVKAKESRMRDSNRGSKDMFSASLMFSQAEV
jgi:hypothetical protein